MLLRLLRPRHLPVPQPPTLSPRRHLVNIKLHPVRDRPLDSVITRDRHLRLVLHLLHLLASRRRLPPNSHSFLRRFPSIFLSPSRLTSAALALHREHLHTLHLSEPDLILRLRKLLMLTSNHSLPLHTINQLSWDLGLPHNYHSTLIPKYPHFFELMQPTGDERIWLRLLKSDHSLAVSHLQKSYADNDYGECLPFPVSFTRGFGLKRKCLSWLEEWQRLPYTSPYAGTAGLDPRTDASEKRIVGVFHELLHLTITKRTERRNVSNLRKPLQLPQKFTKVFERHPGIFYSSEKLGTQTVMLREAFGGGTEMLEKHPLIGIREMFVGLIREGMPERRRRVSGSEMRENGDEHGDRDNVSVGIEDTEDEINARSGIHS